MLKYLKFFSVLLFLTFSLEAYDVAITAFFRDEARFLKERIEYHRLIGVEKFYLILGNCGLE